MRKFWTEKEISILRDTWPHILGGRNILIAELKKRSTAALDLKAHKLGLEKTEKVKEEMRILRLKRQIYMNKNIVGRDLSCENLKQIAAKYSSKTEFKLKDGSAYITAQRIGILEEICSHMIINITTSFPQMFLYELIKLLYPNYLIRFNDRTAIYPKEIDVYLPEIKLGFEYDGFEFHQNTINENIKDDICKLANIRLIRIKELNKRDPIPGILAQMEKFYNITDTIKTTAKNNTLNRFISMEDLTKICSKYTNYSLFLKQEPKCVSLLRKNKLLEIKTTHMKKRIAPSNNEIKKAILCATSKMDIVNNLKVYSKLIKCKDPELMKLYKALPRSSTKIN